MQATQPLLDALACLRLVQQELLLFAAFWFVVGALDELAVDLCWIWLRLTGRAREGRITREAAAAPLKGRAAVVIAAWQEAEVIGHTIAHALAAWRQADFVLYVGCYGNDPATIAAVMAAAGDDPRVRLVISGRPGPSTKADCLNRVYAALCADERRQARRYRALVIHDAEDMVHPAELAVIDAALDHADFVQLPVRPELQRRSAWIGGHYADEFAESHGKAMVVRDALGAAIPAAGVACGFSRAMIARIACRRGQAEAPFAAECLTEDYELGMLVRREGGRSRFLRVRGEDGALVATRAYFPARLEDAVRQKSRWIHGIAFQGWERLDLGGTAVDRWMALRDRRAPLTAIVLACGYVLLAVMTVLHLAGALPDDAGSGSAPWLNFLLVACLAGCIWRCAWRLAFTAREYGLAEGLGAIARMPVANAIAILAGWRAAVSYGRGLRGASVQWDKTQHEGHPALGGQGAGAPGWAAAG